MNKKCETCIKRKTLFCPTSIKCMATDDKPYYQDKIMLLEENKILKDNWIKLKKYIKTEIPEEVFINTEWFVSILDKMQELERSDKKC